MPTATEGPYYYDTALVRQDITEGLNGVPLNLTIKIVDISTCNPIENAAIDIWHCNSEGIYSHFVNAQNEAPSGSTFLRGLQLTDSNGVATTKSIYPGWYTGRATHIHLKVHINGSSLSSTYSGGHVSLTSQLFFNDSLSDIIYGYSVYGNLSRIQGGSRLLLSSDSIYNGVGAYGILEAEMMDSTNGWNAGVIGTIMIVVDTTSTSSTSDTSSMSSTPPSSTSTTMEASGSEAVSNVCVSFSSYYLLAFLSLFTLIVILLIITLSPLFQVILYPPVSYKHFLSLSLLIILIFTLYKARERIHRSVADLRLLATPTSRGRVADPDPN